MEDVRSLEEQVETLKEVFKKFSIQKKRQTARET